jgi:phosphatidylglycerol:prolipoprotein diacylglycerol transferase
MRFNLYGMLIALGVLGAVIYMGRECKRRSLPRDLAVDIVLWAVPLAVVASRLYYVAFTWQRYQHDLLSILRIWEGGLAIYGGVLGGALGVFLLSKRRKLPFALLADLVAPALILGQAIGRWGNFFNGEAYGNLVSNPAWQFFPVAVVADGQWHLATFFIESVWNLAGFLILLKLRDLCYSKGNGMLFLWYLLWYGLGRMVIEGLRTDSLMLGAMRVSQVLSGIMMAISGIVLVSRCNQRSLHYILLAAGLCLLALAALDIAWALIPGYVLMAAFAFSLLFSFARSQPAPNKA